MKHNGMRPQDIVILLCIMVDSRAENTLNNAFPPNNKQIAQRLSISESEVSESLYRSEYAGLIADIKTKRINKKALLDFIIYGLKYAFPAHPMGVGRGISTAHSAEPLKNLIVSDENYVWQHPEGTTRGLIIEPLYRTIPNIAPSKPDLYEFLSLIDGIRTGTSRVVSLASQLIEKRFDESW